MASTSDYQEACSEDGVLRIAIVGMTGTGKSATGNSIIGIAWPDPLENAGSDEEKSMPFESKLSHESVTSMCKVQEATVLGRHVAVVDTPGFFDTHTASQEEIEKEISRCVALTLPGPHAILVVVKIGRFTEEVISAVKSLRTKFGNDVVKYIIVVFTGQDELRRNKMPISKYLQCLTGPYRKLLKDCENRYIAFDNTIEDPKSPENKDQVDRLLTMITDNVKRNGNTFFTDEQLQAAYQKEQERKRKERERIEAKEREKRELKEKSDAAEKALDETEKKLIEVKENMKEMEGVNRQAMEELQKYQKVLETEMRKQHDLQTTYERSRQRIQEDIYDMITKFKDKDRIIEEIMKSNSRLERRIQQLENERKASWCTIS